VYLEGTSRGITTNGSGEYTFELDPGDYRIVFQYVGYKQQVRAVSLPRAGKTMDVVMQTESIKLSEVTVNASGEDPAYPIIRKAIKKRKYYRDLIENYSCKVYIKGNQKLLGAPEKILGQDIGDLGGILDSNRQGIIYLSESLADLYVKGKEKKEVMQSTKVAGNDNGFGFNRATLMDFNMYENTIEVEREIVSPIASNAMNYYRYRLEGSFYDEFGHLIYKIEVLPKRSNDPVFAGYIYITNELYNIQSTDLFVTGDAIKQPILDTLRIQQVHVPIQEPDGWMLLNQNIRFTFSIFGFDFDGVFTGVFSEYDLMPEFPSGFFNNEVFKVEDGANERTVEFWEKIRPVPLTVEEEQDYVKKDSLQEIWESKEYLDSIDRVGNKFKAINLLTGYSYDNSYKRRTFSFSSPLEQVQFNAVQGYLLNLNFNYRQDFDKPTTRFLDIAPTIQYGFSDQQFRYNLKASYQFNRLNFARISLSGGRKVEQFNEQNPISFFLNSWYSLLAKDHFAKLYDRTYGRIEYQQEIVNGIFLWADVSYNQRDPLVNTTNYSFFRRDDIYPPNTPIIEGEPIASFEPHQALITELTLRFRYKQQYITYPKRKYIMGSDWPNLQLSYRRGWNTLGSDVSFDFFRVNLYDNINFGVWGYTDWSLESGVFLTDDQVEFIDFRHFMGNQTLFGNPSNYTRAFYQLPYYDYSTTDPYGKFQLQHHFNGFIFDKLPFLRKLNMKSVVGFNYLYVEDRPSYLEASFGIENLGFGAFRLLRLDVVGQFVGGNYEGTYLILGLDI